MLVKPFYDCAGLLLILIFVGDHALFRGWRVMSKPLTRSLIRRELTGLSKVSFRNSYWFKHSKGIRMKIHKLKKELRNKGYSREDIKKHVEDLVRKEDEKIYNKVIKILTELLYNLAQGKEYHIRLNKIPYYKK